MKSRQIQDKAHVVTLKKHYFGKSQKLLFKVQKKFVSPNSICNLECLL